MISSKGKRDSAGEVAANTISRWIEPWGDARFPIDVDYLALNAHTTYKRDDAITQILPGPWKDFDGFLQRNPDNPKEWLLSYKESSPPERQRFTKAHELAHYVLHSQKRSNFRCGANFIIEQDTGEPNIEAQANQFASCLLMPGMHVRARMQSKNITLDFISDLAKFYGVSFEAMCIRVVELTGVRAVLVNWNNGMMLRWSRSLAAKEQRLWIDRPKDMPLEPFPGTLAADTSVRQCSDGVMLPANLWFKNAPQGEMLREMKHTSDIYERVLSLLIVPKFESRWARDGDEGHTTDSYDNFIEHGQLPVR